MKKGFLLIAIIFWIIIAVCIISVTIFIANGGISNLRESDILVKNEEIILGKAQNIVIEGTSQSVEIRKTSGDRIIVSQYGNQNSKEENLFLVSTSEDQVQIYFNKTRNYKLFNFFNYNERLVVEIPEDFHYNLNAKTSSGNLKIEDNFALNKVQLLNSSGGIHVNKNLTAETLDLKTSSGEILFEGDITAENLFAGSSSGGIRLQNVNVNNYNLQCSSGEIKVGSISGGGEARTSSGGIHLSLKNPKGDISIGASSGSIDIELEPSLEFTLDAQTSSGGIHTNFAVVKNEKGNKATANIGDNPTVNIIANASSGSIRIKK
jgi:lia operon protein LiaG